MYSQYKQEPHSSLEFSIHQLNGEKKYYLLNQQETKLTMARILD